MYIKHEHHSAGRTAGHIGRRLQLDRSEAQECPDWRQVHVYPICGDGLSNRAHCEGVRASGADPPSQGHFVLLPLSPGGDVLS